MDEWQRLPQVWDAVRRQVDSGAPAGRFLLTGSATPIDSQGAHSGAGRILSLRMRPMGLHERGVIEPTVSLSRILEGECPALAGSTAWTVRDYVAEITQSGFPGALGLDDRGRRAFLDSYLATAINLDPLISASLSAAQRLYGAG